MKSKPFGLIILVLCLIISSVRFLTHLFFTSHLAPKDLLILEIPFIQKFEIVNFTSGLRFEQHEDGTWWISRFTTDLQKKIGAETKSAKPAKANREKVVAYLFKLSLGKLDTQIPTKSSPEVFGINDSSLNITFYGFDHQKQQQKQERIFIGKNSLDSPGIYIMKEGESELFWLQQDIKTEALWPYEAWLETP